MYNSLKADNILTRSNIKIELGRILNKNKNPVVDKAIRELVRELLILNPIGGTISPAQLSQAIANLNCRYRKSGLSAHELWTQRDQITNEQLPISDREVILQQYHTRIQNHPHSQKSKAHGEPPHPTPKVQVGSLVFTYSDRNKLFARMRYLVTSVKGNNLKLRKFTEKLFGVKEIDARLDEVYPVPSFEDTKLPTVDYGAMARALVY